MNRLKRLVKDSGTYGLGAILAKGISFFMLPVYTHVFTPADYGSIEMLSVIASFLAAILTLGMDSAQSFYFFKQKDKGRAEQSKLVTAVLQWRLTWGIAIVGIATLMAPLLNQLFFEGNLGWEYFAIAFTGTLLAQIMSQSVEIFRLLYRPWPYVLINLAQTTIAAGLILTFVIALNQGILGYFVGTLLASAITACLGWYLVREYLEFDRLHSEWWMRLLRFGLPLLPASLAMYVMSTTDRWFIRHYQGEIALGIYAVGAKFALIMALAIETFRKAWWPIAMDAMHSDDGPETFRMIARMFMGGGVAAVVYLSFLSPWLLWWLVAPAFREAWKIVGVLAWQSLFYGFYLIASAGIWKAEKTNYSLYIMAGAAGVNVALNWWLVPAYGGMGAAIATALSYLFLVGTSMVVSERLWKVDFEAGVMLAQIALGAASVAVMATNEQRSWPFVLGIHLVVVALLISTINRQVWNMLKKNSVGNV